MNRQTIIQIVPNESANNNATHAMRCYSALRNFVVGVDASDGLDAVDVADDVGEVVYAGVSSPHMALFSFVVLASFELFLFFETTSSQSIVDIAIDSSAFCWYMIMASAYATLAKWTSFITRFNRAPVLWTVSINSCSFHICWAVSSTSEESDDDMIAREKNLNKGSERTRERPAERTRCQMS